MNTLRVINTELMGLSAAHTHIVVLKPCPGLVWRQDSIVRQVFHIDAL